MSGDDTESRNPQTRDYPRDIAPLVSDDTASWEPENASGVVIVLSLRPTDSTATPGIPPSVITATLTTATVVIAPIVVAPGVATNGAGAAPAQLPAPPSSATPAVGSAEQQPIAVNDPTFHLRVDPSPPPERLTNMFGNVVTANLAHSARSPVAPPSQTPASDSHPTPAQAPERSPSPRPTADGTQGDVEPSAFDTFAGTFDVGQTAHINSAKHRLDFYRSQSNPYHEESDLAGTSQVDSSNGADATAVGQPKSGYGSDTSASSLYSVYAKGWGSKGDKDDGGAGSAGSAGAVQVV